MKAEHNTKLLESSWSQPSTWQLNLILCQVLHDFLDLLDIFGELGVIGLVSLRNLFYFAVSNSRGAC